MNIPPPLTKYKEHLEAFEDKAGPMFVRLANALPNLDIAARVKLLEKMRKKLLTTKSSHLILKFLCFISDVDYDRFLDSISYDVKEEHRADLPRLLCHILCMWGSCFSDTYMSQILELDVFEVQQLIDHLKHTFTVDNPVRWLQSLANKYEEQRLAPLKAKLNLMHGREVTGQAVDTREERRVKNRNLKKLSPYIDRF